MSLALEASKRELQGMPSDDIIQVLYLGRNCVCLSIHLSVCRLVCQAAMQLSLATEALEAHVTAKSAVATSAVATSAVADCRK